MNPLVSILIPAYNAQEWISDTLRSALAQTWRRREIIVVDDGSRDQTAALVRQFESSEVRLVTQENRGAAAARNTAFSLSRGDYIQWLDADDLLAADKIALQMAALGEDRDTRTVLSCSWGHFLCRWRCARFSDTPLWRDLSPSEWLLRYMENNIYMQTATWLVSREVTETAGPWDTRLLGDDDGEYFSRVLMASNGTRFVSEAKSYYRMSGSARLSYIGNSDKKKDAQWLSMKLHVDYLRSLDDSQRARKACVTYLQNWMCYFYPERLDIFEHASRLARELGGHLDAPRLPWKYDPIRAVFGWPLARRAQMVLPGLRHSFYASWDKALFRLSNPYLRGTP
jgi:glycosyltransferase involved in cell wall biosynthesis